MPFFLCISPYSSRMNWASLGSAYYRGDRATQQLIWWKGYIGSFISDIMADSPSPEQFLVEDDIYREMISAMNLPAVASRIKEARKAYGFA